MKWFAMILGLTGFAFFSTSACNSKTTIRGSGNITTESRQVSGFREVSVSGSGHLSITQGEIESLEIECDDNLMPYIQTVVKNETLKIGPKDVSLRPSRPIEYRLALRDLDTLRTSGSVSVESPALRTENLKASVSGSGSFSLEKLEAQSLTFDIRGSGEVNIESGESGSQTISISGSGEFNVPNLKSQDIEITISGSGRTKVWVTEKLDVKISGSGKIQYYGSPTVSSRVSGSGKIESLGTKP